MRKRIMSLILCFVLVLGMFPGTAHADYEDGAECANCDHWHYDDWMCECGLCSANCSNSDCWYETHCKNCGACYMSADNWCDECGWCEDCMKNEENTHCEDCGRCFVGDSKDELCERCNKCSDCVGGICDECGLCDECADDDHCENCPAHLEDDDVCGYCKDCALTMGLHCEECGECFEEDAEPCPVHPNGAHCEDCAGFICETCGHCEYEDGIELCPDCELCTECCEEISMSEGCSTGEICVESSDWGDHICEQCGECFCEKERCVYCGLCEDCCIENAEAAGCYCGNICVEDPDWDSHFESCHGDGEIPAEHKHRYKTEWSVNETHHWHDCRICDTMDNESYAAHRLTAAGKCEVCGFDTHSPLFFISQPNDLTRRVTNGNAEDPDDPDGSLKNRAVFSVSAMNLAGEELEFQWYMGLKALADEEGYISGSKTNVLNIAVPSDGCGNEYEYYCVVKSKDASGNPISIESSHAALRIVHNYGPLEADAQKWHMAVINYTDDEGGKHANVYYATGSTEHNSFCYGSDCNHTKFKKGSNHSFEYDRYLGSGHFASESESASVKYFYITKCSECGYENLLYTEENSELIYNISIQDTPGAYAMNDDDVEGVTKAKTGEHIAVIAPYVNKAGNVFDHWEVISGPKGFTNASIENYFGVGSFNMPAGSIVLRCVYSTDKVPVKEVQVKGVSPAIDEKGYITVEVGETFTVTSIISPDNVADKRVSWVIDSAGTIKFTEKYSALPTEIRVNDIEGDVPLIALKPGIVLLRAISTESNNTSSNTPIQDSVYVKVVPAKGETHNYEETVVYPTCTKNGYTLHKCTDEGCNKSYQNNIKAATKHSDTDGDGLCDNVDRNTGKVCGYKMGGENTSMVGLTKIKKVELTIDAPMHGGSPATTATPTGDEKDYYSVANIAWNPDTKTFVGGTKYSVLIELEAKDKYGFKLDGIEVANTQFYINGNKATVVSKGAQEVSISYEFPATGTGSSSSGTGSATYTVTVLDSTNGSVTADRKTAPAGAVVTLTVSPDKGCALETLTVLDKSGKEIKLTEKNGKYTFAMPASSVTVEAVFKAEKSGSPFVDVPSGSYYEDAVIWAADKGITGGTDAAHFAPNGVCTRAQAVTFLWRAAGSPAPKSAAMPFTDVKAGSYYEQAVLWAVENGITKGTSDTTFSPDLTCSRAQIVTFLWRSQKSPAAGSENPFTDVKSDAYYADAVLWAVKENVTSGTAAATFSPDADCTRAQIVTFIYRVLAE